MAVVVLGVRNVDTLLKIKEQEKNVYLAVVARLRRYARDGAGCHHRWGVVVVHCPWHCDCHRMRWAIVSEKMKLTYRALCSQA